MRDLATLLMAVGLLILVASVCGGPDAHSERATGAPFAVTANVTTVTAYNTRSAVSYCQIDLDNGRSLTNVYGAECAARPGRTVELVYQPIRICRVWLCRDSRRLLSWR